MNLLSNFSVNREIQLLSFPLTISFRLGLSTVSLEEPFLSFSLCRFTFSLSPFLSLSLFSNARVNTMLFHNNGDLKCFLYFMQDKKRKEKNNRIASSSICNTLTTKNANHFSPHDLPLSHHSETLWKGVVMTSDSMLEKPKEIYAKLTNADIRDNAKSKRYFLGEQNSQNSFSTWFVSSNY